MLLTCPSCGKHVSNRAPICPFCGAMLPAATADRDATPARGISPAATIPSPPPPPAPRSSSAPPEADPLGPFDRVRPLDTSGRTWLGFTPEGGGRAAVLKALGDADRQAAALWTALPPHPSLVRASGPQVGEEAPRIVYEYVAPDAHGRKAQGRSAFERRLRLERLAFPDVLRLGVLACRGLEHAYEGGLRGHGNLKPSNLLLGLDGGLRVSEPGLSGIESPLELAPERFDGAPADERSDVYSLGVLLYHMAGGRPPFDTPAGGRDGAAHHREALRHLHKDALVPRLDSPLAAVLERCLQKAPLGRFPAVAALRSELQDLLRRETGLLPPLHPPGEATGWERAQQALALLAVGRAEPAVRAFDEALALLPRTGSVHAVHAVRATALHVLGQHEEAVRAAEQAIAVDPQHAHAWRQKGESLAALGRREEALDALEQTVVIAPRDAASLVALGRVLGAVGRLPQALSAYDRAVAADPEHLDVWLERGRTLAAAGLRADAAGTFLRFLDLSPAGHPARPAVEEMLREVRKLAGEVAPLPVRATPPPPEPLPEPQPAANVLPEPAPTSVAPEEPEPQPLPPATPPAPTEPEPTDVAGLNQRGIRLFREGRLDQALGAFDRALELDSRRAATWSNRGNVLFRLGRALEGLADQERALAREPRSLGAWLSKATIEKALGRPAQARRSLLDLLSLRPPPDPRLMDQARSVLAELEGQGIPPGPRTSLGFLLAGVQHAEAAQLEEAVVDFDEALGRDALLATASLFKADALLALGRGAEAARVYEEGLAADPDELRLLVGLGRARARLGDLDGATVVLTRALGLADGESRPQVERLLKAVAARRAPAPVPEAQPVPAPVAAPAPATAEPVELPHAPSAVTDAKAADLPPPLRQPNDPTALAAQGRHAEALDSLDRAFAAGTDDAPFWMARGDSLRALGRNEEAAAAFDQAIKRTPQDFLAWMKKGDALDGAKLFADAVACYDRAVELHPRHFGAWNAKGVCLTHLDRIEEAHHCFIRALELDSRFALARFNKGAAEDRLGRGEAALDSYQAFLSLAPPNLRAQIQYAQKRVQALKAPRLHPT